ncbi:hypothetical protein T4D_13884 [Trichinella pseudospiralis]|uniref:Uncharacterized protein n=1 Tax=Trichinella pseudospiralis TaxID=6337 RepID=A0A0V1FYE8_TRIPS|nr:hypothetical protein T4D_13884 [Trichinella pseudospiralis]
MLSTLSKNCIFRGSEQIIYIINLILVVFLKKGKLYSGFSLLQPLPALLNVPYFKGKQSGF